MNWLKQNRLKGRSAKLPELKFPVVRFQTALAVISQCQRGFDNYLLRIIINNPNAIFCFLERPGPLDSGGLHKNDKTAVSVIGKLELR